MNPIPTLGNEKPSSPSDADLLSSFSAAEVFDRKYGHVIEADEALKPSLLGWSTGGPLLDQLAEYMVRNGKKCHIVAGEAASSFDRASVVPDKEIFFTLMCERRAEGEDLSGNDSADLGELERKIMTLLQTLDSENVVVLEQEYVAEASDVDTIIWNVQNNRRMEEPPEYVIDVQKSGQEDLVIRVLKREGDKYAVKIDQMMSPFVASSNENIADGYEIQQILQRVEGTDAPSGSDGSEAPTIPVSAVISRGFCLTIPDVGTILLSPEGSVAIGGITTEKSMYISSPMDVTVSDSNVRQMEVVANHMNVTRLEGDVGEISEIGTLHFHHRGSSNVSGATLSVMAGAHLKARDMFIECAEVVNLGQLSISNEANLNGGNLANYGTLEADTMDNMVVFDGISHLFNQESGVIHSHGQLIISSATACNVGIIDVSMLDMVMAGAMENYGIIHSHGKCSISCCDSIYNRKVIDSGGDLEIRTNSLNNDRGRIISRGKANFIVRDRIDNHGNCLVDRDVPEKVEYYTPLSSDRAWRKGPPGSGVDTQRNIIENKRDVYGWDPDNTSTITSYGDMVVSVATGDFDNSFGSLCALSGISINAHDGNVVNENGRIFVRGRAVFTGKNFRNGYVKGDQIFSGPGIPHEVDPEVVIGLAGYGQNIDVSSILDKIGSTGLYPFVKGEKVQVWNECLAGEASASVCFGPPIAGSMTSARRREGGPATIVGNNAKTFVNAKVFANSLPVPNHTPPEIVKTYKPLASHSQASAEPGQIYATDDVEIRTEGERYFGTITAGKDIIANNNLGTGVSMIGSSDRSRLVAGGDVKIALCDPSDRKYLSVQAKSLQINTEKPVVHVNNEVGMVSSTDALVKDIDLMTLGQSMGLMDEVAFHSCFGEETISVRDIKQVNFVGEPPQTDMFISAIPDRYMHQMAVMTLSPTHGRAMVDNEHLVALLEQNGYLMGGAKDVREAVEQQKQPTMVYHSTGQTVEVEINGETKTIAVCMPHLIYSQVAGEELPTEVDDFRIHSKGYIKLNEGKFGGISYKNLAVESESLLGAESKYVYASDGNKAGIEQLYIPVSGNLVLSGDAGVYTRAVHVASGGSTQITSSRGDVKDEAMVTDTKYSTLEFPQEHVRRLFFRIPMSRPPVQAQEKTVYVSTFETGNDLSMDARGDISLESTQLSAGNDMEFSAQRMMVQPATAYKAAEHRSGDDYARSSTSFPVGSTLRAGNRITFAANDTTLMGANVVAEEVVIPEGSNAKLIPAMGQEDSYVETKKKRKVWFISLGSSRAEQFSSRTVPVPSTLTARRLFAPGKDKLELTSTIVNIPGMAVLNKSLFSGTAHEEVYSSSHTRSRGLFPPSIRLNPMPALGQDFVHNFSLGDAIPTMENVIGATAETLTQAITLSKLASNPHPLATVASIVASKVAPFGIFNRVATMSRDERVPVPSEVNIGIFIADNDETHLTGHWKVDEGYIHTKKLRAEAAEHSLSQTTETKEWRMSLVPTAFIPGLGTGLAALMPTISGASSSSTVKSQTYDPMTLSANKLIIRCDDAVFRGATLRSKVVDMIVNNDMTVESLANMFQASERNDSFSISLSALSSLADEVKALTWDQKLAAVPSIRHEKIEELHRSVDTVAQCIGTEEFYLKVGGTFYTKRADVGLRPDGFVSKNTAERIEANRKIEEELRDINFRSRQVLNTAAISEFGNMMGKINQLRAEVAKQAAINHLSPDDVDRLDRDVQEFLNDPDVKDSLDKLERAEEKLNAVTVQLAELEVDSENVSPSTVEGNELSSGIEETTPHDSTAEREAQMALPPEYIALEANRDSLVHEVFQQVTAFRQRYEEFAANHPHLMKIGGLALKGIGYVSLGGLIKAGVKLGGKKMLALFGSQVLSQELIASVIENGTDALVDRAIVCASNEQEAAEFAKTAVWAVEATLAGAAVVGVAGLVKDKAAITNKLQATKINVSSAVKAKFSQKQALRTESSQKITAVIEEKATARANQRKTGNVGTYKELTRGAPKGGFQDGKEANHIPSKAFMKKYGISEDEGLAILMTKKQHAKTRTMRQPPTNNTPRDELTKDLLDVKKILKEDGNYTPDINRDLLKGVKDYQSKHLDIFKKEPKK